MNPLFTFDSTHLALWAEEVAGEYGIPVEVVPAPPAAHARCNLALETAAASVETLAAVLESEGIAFARYSSSP